MRKVWESKDNTGVVMALRRRSGSSRGHLGFHQPATPKHWLQSQKFLPKFLLFSTGLLALFMITLVPSLRASATEFTFSWVGQIAGFTVDGRFSFDKSQSFLDNIVREEHLQSFDINFYDPSGSLLKSYTDNHLSFPEFNFAFDLTSQSILQDGIYTGPEGLNVGEKTPDGSGGFTGFNLWSRSKPTSSPLMHVDDWDDSAGFPLGYSSHEDISFFFMTTQELIDTGKVGDTYIGQTHFALDRVGERVAVQPIPEPSTLLLFGVGAFLLLSQRVRSHRHR